MNARANSSVPVADTPHLGMLAFLRWVALISGALVAIIGAVALCGWIFNVPELRSIVPTFPGMKTNTAIALILAGITLFLSARLSQTLLAQRVQTVTASLVLVIGVVTLGEHIFDWDAGIDQLLFRETTSAPGTLSPNRMAPNSALLLTLFGSSLLMSRFAKTRLYVHIPALAAALLLLPTIISYFYGVDFIYGNRSYTKMALPTAIAFTLLLFGVLATHPDRGIMRIVTTRSAGGYLARRLLPIAMLLPLLIGWPILKGEHAQWYNAETRFFLTILVLTVIFTVISWFNARGIHKVDMRQKQLENELRRAKQNLERLVNERTKQLTLSNRELERSNRELQDFAYVASHDLQEPLRKIQSFSNLLGQDSGRLSGDDRLYLERIASAASRMSTLISDLLTFSRVTTKARPFKAVGLQQIAQDVLSDLEVRIQESGASIDIGPLPIIQADPVHMRQLFQNLLSNALKFARADMAPMVKVRSAKRGSILTLTFTDNGIGFEQKYADRIFTIFERLHAKNEYSGTGIGLAIVKKIVDRHHGTIEVKSKPNKGATFTIKLPIKTKRS